MFNTLLCNLLTVTLISCLIVPILSDADRKVTLEYNPGCHLTACSGNTSVNIVYARSEGQSDCLHYVLSTVGPSAPTILLLKSNYNSSKIIIAWEKLLSSPLNITKVEGSIYVGDENGKPYPNSSETSLYILDQLVEYKDVENNADITDIRNIYLTSTNLRELSWNISIVQNVAFFQGTMSGSSSNFTKSSNFNIRFTAYNETGRSPTLPRIAYNDLSSKLEVILDNVTANSSNSRFSLLLHVSNPGKSSFKPKAPITTASTIEQVAKRNIDDEYAPSIFTFNRILSKRSQVKTFYWQWRTVCYTLSSPSRKYSSDVASTPLVPYNKTISNVVLQRNRVLIAYFGRANLDEMDIESTIVSFGKKDDGFYVATNYTSWTSLLGFGIPPPDNFSIAIISILFAGIGLPVLIILFTAMYMFRRKYLRYRDEKSKSGYQPIE